MLTSDSAEEVEDAGLTLPRSIMWAVYINGAIGFIMAVTMCFCLGGLSEIVDTPTGYPFIQVFYNSTNSYAAANIMTAIMIVTLTACCISEVSTSSRQLWSFVGDKRISFSNWFAYVCASKKHCLLAAPVSLGNQLTSYQGSPTLHIPLRATIVTMSITCLISLINVGSTAALNAIVSLAIVSLLSSYFITIACLLWRLLKGDPLPPRRWSLGTHWR